MLPTLTLLALAPAAARVAFEPGSEFEAARAVLESRCLPCHGGERRESELSFADAATFAAGGSRGRSTDPDDLPSSRLIEVTSYRNPDLAMPPSGVLPAEERAVLEAWVLAGAPWPEGDAGRLADPDAHPLRHDDVAGVEETWWAYEPLVAPSVPAAPDGAHPIDAFIAARLESAGLQPAVHAGPEALLRRATFDLTGLPPTAGERDAFVLDVDARGFDAAWSTLLDRLFASPHYGEQQARHWLDLVRYAETNGYERDTKKKNVWRYRDWVVRAFDRDLPYDRFIALQLAGDELARELDDPRARDQAILATGFFRLGVWDDEPVDRKQAAADGRADVIDTLSQVVMATTMGCARCHDHKADPITQAEYFELTAHVRGVRPYGGAPEAQLLDPERDGVRPVAERDADLAEVHRAIADEAHALGLDAPPPTDGARRVRTLVADARAAKTTWRYRFGEPVDGWHTPAFHDAAWEEGRAGFGRRGTPRSVVRTDWHNERIQIRTTFRLESIPDALRLSLHYDDDVQVFLNGQLVLERGGYVVEYGSFQLPREARAALVVGRNVLAIDCKQDFGGQYIDAGLDTACDPTAEGGPIALLEAELERRGGGAKDDPALACARALLAQRLTLLAEVVNQPYPAQVVTEVGPEPPTQRVHLRGSVHAPGDEVAPNVPAAWRKGSAASVAYEPPARGVDGARTSGRRSALAAWLFDGGAHVAARVEANRTWQFLFGRGLCRSVGDFGRLGEQPTHPALLDHLAAELVARGWSRKSLQRYLMESVAYRRTTVGTDAALAADPRNDLLWRFDPRRLTAEEYRDAVLAASGELSLVRFGPSVYPPLPDEVLATSSRPGQAWGRASGDDAVRRSLYVHVKRSLREPLLAALDQPDPDLPCPERFPTNVPTQALLTLNGDFAQQRAAAFAASLAAEHADRRDRVASGIVRAFGRSANADEIERALALLDRFEGEIGVDEARALELFALGLLNRNEFSWLD
ncbi:MAG: PSD1 and planctomycete cytochrome C domain-containing protein [Planctomycetota bacterium]